MDCCTQPGIRWRYGQHDLTIQFSTYEDGSLAVGAFDGDCEPYAILSVRMPPYDDPPPAGVFFLKDWSENKPIATALIHSGLIEAVPLPQRQNGYVIAVPFRFTDRELTFDEAEAQGWDGTGRDGDARFPYHVHDIWQAPMLDHALRTF